MEFETRKNDYIILKFNRKRTVPLPFSYLALAAVSDGLADSPRKTAPMKNSSRLFADVDNNPDRMFITSTLRQEPVWDPAGLGCPGCAIEFFKRMRPQTSLHP